MKVQSINNQNNISHKAYFNSNAEFKYLYGKNEFIQKELISKFRQLPDHELEIVAVEKNGGLKTKYTVFNNFTAKSISHRVEDRFDALSVLMRFLLEKGEEQEKFFKPTPQEQEGFYKLTYPNFSMEQ